MTIAELIGKKRKELGLTLEDVGRAVGVSKATVQRWESGVIHNMKRDKISALSHVLDLDPTLFITPAEVLSETEKRLVQAFRSADPSIQAAVKKLLDIPDAQKKDFARSAM